MSTVFYRRRGIDRCWKSARNHQVQEWPWQLLIHVITSCHAAFLLYKPKFHGSSFLVASSWHPLEDVAHVSRGNRGVTNVSDKDAARMLATCPQQVVRVVLMDFENDTTHGQTGSTIHRGRPPADQSGKRKDGEAARHARHPRSILSVVSARMLRGCYEETAPVEFQLYCAR